MTTESTEQIVFSGYPYRATGRSGGIKLVVAFLVIIGLATLIFFGLGLVFLLAAFLVYKFGGSGSGPKGVAYILTNRRAMVVNQKNTNQVFGECTISDTVPISQMKRNVSSSAVTSNTSHSIAAVVGDVVFMQGANVKVRFDSVTDPDGIVKTVEEIKKSLFAE